MNRDEALDRLTAARVATLSTTSPDGHPHVVPIVFALSGNQLVTVIDHKPKRTRKLQRLINIAGEPRVSVLADSYSENWDRLWWVRADGVAEVSHDGGLWEEAVDLLATKYEPYRTNRPDGPLISVTVGRVVGWKAGPDA